MTTTRRVTPALGTRKYIPPPPEPPARAVAPSVTKCAGCVHRNEIEPCDARFNVQYGRGNGFVVVACDGFVADELLAVGLAEG
jgi:hypothetical protein